MYSVEQIQHVHLEISSRCNAACPLCPRNLYGYPFNDGYVEYDMKLVDAKTIFSKEFIAQLSKIYINGNFGDIVMNRDAIEIVRYFRKYNKLLEISISTNGSARDTKFWTDLAKLNTEVIFCIDGLEDTHHLYRQNTLFEVVLQNAKTFISAGGNATWKFIPFDHNRHQIAKAKKLAKQLGFKKFSLSDWGRNTAPVFSKDQQLTHVIGVPKKTDFKELHYSRTNDDVLLEDIISERTPKTISCQVKKQKSIYISSTGDVYPCCFLGFSPKTYGHGNYHQAANAQFKDMVKENNALEFPLEHCIKWFNLVEQSWNVPTFEQGRLVICNDNCGLSS